MKTLKIREGVRLDDVIMRIETCPVNVGLQNNCDSNTCQTCWKIALEYALEHNNHRVTWVPGLKQVCLVEDVVCKEV